MKRAIVVTGSSSGFEQPDLLRRIVVGNVLVALCASMLGQQPLMR
jgi:hypothetical protein